MSALTQDRVKTALQAALDGQPGKKDSKWTGSDEAAAMGGVIEFLVGGAGAGGVGGDTTAGIVIGTWVRTGDGGN